MTTVAFKEWAAVCDRLAAGRQSLILRKGGIHEESGLFRPDHDRFWLYPTRFHESHQRGLKPDIAPPPDATPTGTVALTALAVVHAVYHLETLDAALALDPLHCWTAETVAQRFHYRKPGLFALAVRVRTLPEPWVIAETEHYAGCKTWVPLGVEPPGSVEDGAVVAVGDAEFAEFVARLNRLSTAK